MRLSNLTLYKLTLSFGTFALAVAGAASTYRVTLFERSMFGATELKPGDYNIELRDGKAVIKAGRKRVEAPVRVETADERFPSTSVRYSNGDGKYHVQEIRVGGTNTKLIFNN